LERDLGYDGADSRVRGEMPASVAELHPDVDIDIYSDVVCPWCYIGKRRLETALAEFDGDVNLTYKPFQLDPSTPKDAHPLLEWLAPKFGGPERARQLTSHTTQVAAADGIEMHYDTALIANTFTAHRLAWYAAREGVGPAVVEALHRAHFTEGRNIGSIDDLTAIAVVAGLDEAAVREFLDSDAGVAEVTAEIQEAYALGISSVPTFVFAGKYAVSGAQDPETLLATLREVQRREGESVKLQPVGPAGPVCDDDVCEV
jgi:predicted DsbA family dithiol-disulfide isomerase